MDYSASYDLFVDKFLSYKFMYSEIERVLYMIIW